MSRYVLKKIIYFWILLTLCFLMTSCRADDSGETRETSYIETKAPVETQDDTEIFTAISPTIQATESLSSSEHQTGAATEPESSETSTEKVVLDPKAKVQHTIMIYMVGSDLESTSAAATSDMKEILASGVDLSNVRVLLYTGGSARWHSDIPIEMNALFWLSEDGFQKIADYPERSMGDPDNLTYFLTYSYEEFPSDEYSLILWNHGNGPVIGYGSDKLHENDALTLPEMRSALENSPFGPDNKLSLIGFDACMMASAELAYVVRDYGLFLVASEETEPNFGWNYQFLEGVAKCTPKELACSIVDHYIEYCEDYGKKHTFFESEATLAVIDLTQADQLETMINNLFLAAKKDVSGGFRRLVSARISGRSIGKAGTGSDYDLVDLGNLATEMAKDYPKQAEALLELLDQLIIYQKSNTVGCSGLSLFYPFYNKNYYDYFWRENYRKIGIFSGYISYLDRYEKVWLGTDAEHYFATSLQPGQSGEYEYRIQLQAEQVAYYAKAGYYILQRTGQDVYRAIYYSPNVTEEDGILYATFDGKVLYIQDQYGRSEILPVTVKEHVENRTYYTTDVFFHNESNLVDMKDMTQAQYVFSVDQENGEIKVVSIMKESPDADKKIPAEEDKAKEDKAKEDPEKDETEEPTALALPEETLGLGKREIVDPEDWNLISVAKNGVYHLTRNEYGAVCAYDQWERQAEKTYIDLTVADGISFAYAPLYEEEGYEYYILFDIWDVQGNRYGSELLPIAATIFTEEEVEEESYEAEFEYGKTLELSFDEKIQLYVREITDPLTGKSQIDLGLNNANDYAIGVKLDDMFLNESAQALGSYRFTLEGQTRTSIWADTFGNLIKQEAEAELQTLELTVTLIRKENAKTLLYEKKVRIHFPSKDEEKPEPDLEPVLGEFTCFLEAMAQEQVLANGKQYKITLLGMGQTTREEEKQNALCFSFLLENKSNKYRSFYISGLSLNGCFIELPETIVSLQPYKHTYLKIFVPRDKIEEVEVYGISEVALMIQANSLKRKLVEGETWHSTDIRWYPVVLSQKSEMKQSVKQGVLLQKIGAVSVLYLGSENTTYPSSENGAGKFSWKIMVMNESDFNIMMDLMETKLDGITTSQGPFLSPMLSNAKIGAHTVRYLELYYIYPDEASRGRQIDFTLAIRSYNGDDTIVNSNMFFTLIDERSDFTENETEKEGINNEKEG